MENRTTVLPHLFISQHENLLKSAWLLRPPGSQLQAHHDTPIRASACPIIAIRLALSSRCANLSVVSRLRRASCMSGNPA